MVATSRLFHVGDSDRNSKPETSDLKTYSDLVEQNPCDNCRDRKNDPGGAAFGFIPSCGPSETTWAEVRSQSGE